MARLLVVDDRRPMRRAVKEVLEPEHSVTLAPNGQCALALFESERPDVVLLDLLMPDMNGTEVIEGIKRIDANARIVVLTCLDEVREVVRLFRQGVLNYLVKPVDPAELREAVRQALLSCPIQRVSYVETPTSRQAEDAVKRAASAQEPLILYGRPGSGRRTALNRACEELSMNRLLTVDAASGSPAAVLRGVMDRFDETVDAVCLCFHRASSGEPHTPQDARSITIRIFRVLCALRKDRSRPAVLVAGIVDVDADPFTAASGEAGLSRTRGVSEAYVKSPRERPEELGVLVGHFSTMRSDDRRASEADASLVDNLQGIISSRSKLDNLRFVRAASVEPALVAAAEHVRAGDA